jgi:5-methylcytosine-specific restriction endonuclease McrA
MGLKRKFERPSKRVQSSKRWKALRLRVLRRDNWQCVQCGARGRVEVDHILPVRDRPDLAFDEDNLQTLCRRHHSRKTRQEMGFPEPDPERVKWWDLLKKPMNENTIL